MRARERERLRPPCFLWHPSSFLAPTRLHCARCDMMGGKIQLYVLPRNATDPSALFL